MFLKLKTQKCENAYANCCIPDYSGRDNLGITIAGCDYKQSQIRTNTAYFMSDGSMIMWNGYSDFIIDINGISKPNKWEHDLFAIYIVSDGKHFRFKGFTGGCGDIKENNGISSGELVKKLFGVE